MIQSLCPAHLNHQGNAACLITHPSECRVCQVDSKSNTATQTETEDDRT